MQFFGDTQLRPGICSAVNGADSIQDVVKLLLLTTVNNAVFDHFGGEVGNGVR